MPDEQSAKGGGPPDDPRRVVDEWEDCYILASGEVVYKPGHEPMDSANEPVPSEGYPSVMPPPSDGSDDHNAWAKWLIEEFLGPFIASWRLYAGSWRPLPDSYITGEPPAALKAIPGTWWTNAAEAVQRFCARGSWRFKYKYQADLLAGLLREIRDQLAAGDYESLDYEKLQDFKRDLEGAITRGAEAGTEQAGEATHETAPGNQRVSQVGEQDGQEDTPAELPQQAVSKRPSDNAFKAWRLRDLTGLKTQEEIAEAMSKELGRRVSQGEVSRWLKEVKGYMKAGNVLPSLPSLTRKPDSIDPAVIENGARVDKHSKRQRERRDPDAD